MFEKEQKTNRDIVSTGISFPICLIKNKKTIGILLAHVIVFRFLRERFRRVLWSFKSNVRPYIFECTDDRALVLEFAPLDLFCRSARKIPGQKKHRKITYSNPSKLTYLHVYFDRDSKLSLSKYSVKMYLFTRIPTPRFKM